MAHELDPLPKLLELIAGGDENAMSQLYDLTVKRIYGLALRVVLSPELAEEVVSDVYMQVWRTAGKFDAQRSGALPWLMMICRTRGIDRLRRETSATRNQYPEDEKAQFEDENTLNPVQEMAYYQLAAEVRESLLSLNEKQCEAIMLAFYEGLSHQEISKRTGVPLGSVKTNIRRGQEILRKTLAGKDLIRGGIHG